MKVLILALALTCVAAVPKHNLHEVDSQRIIDQVIANAIREVFEAVAQYDPVVRHTYAGEWALPNGGEILSASGYVIDVNAAGFSNLVQNSVIYDLWTGDFSIDLAFPSVTGSVGRAYGEVNFFDHKLTAFGSGSAEITGFRAAASANIGLGSAGITVRDVNVEIFLTDVDVSLDLTFAGREIGASIASFLNRLPEYVVSYKAQITAVLNYVAQVIIDRVL